MGSYFFHLSTSLALTGITTLGLGLFVFLEKKRNKLGLIFLLWCLSIAWWSLLELVIITRHSPHAAIFWGRITQAGDIFLPTLFVHFVLTLLNYNPKRWVLPTLYGISSGFALLCFTPLVISGVEARVVVPYFLSPGPLYIPMLVFFAGCVLYAQLKLFDAYRKASGQNRAKLGYFFFSSIAGFIGGCMNFLLVFDVKAPALYSYGTYAVPMFVAATSYSIVRYRLMDITVVMEKGLAHLLLLTVIAVPPFFILAFAQKTYFGEINYHFSLVLFLTLTLIVLGASRIKSTADATIARVLFPNRFDMYETLSHFSKSLVTILDLRSLTEEIVGTLTNLLGTKTASLYILDKEKGAYVRTASHPADQEGEKPSSLTVGHPLPHQLSTGKAILIREELEHHANEPHQVDSLLPTLKALGAEVCIPLINKDRLLGFCILGARLRRRMYTDEELNLLTTLAQNAAIALDNALLYEDVRRTQLLMRRTDRLRSLETIAGGFAHEIRNPLTSIKTFVQLAPERKDDMEFMEHFGKVVAEDVDRIERLIQEILDYARYMEPKFTEEDLNEVVSSCLYFVEVKAGSKFISLKKDLADDLPPIRLDRQQIKQVLLNLFLNAMEAMAEKGGRLLVRTHRLVKPATHPWVQIEVVDTGPGIPEEDLEHIFDPFYTTKHESVEREGTGLGLTIVHQIVQEHGGYIDVDSEVGRGTTFFVNLPAKPLEALRHKTKAIHEEAHPIG